MKIDLSDGFTDEVAALEAHFENVTTSLQRGDFTTLKRALTAIVKVANVVLTVLTALESAKAKK